MSRPESRSARIAAWLADPAHMRLLAPLLSGESRTVGELARASGITPQATASQLARLEGAGLVRARRQVRHTYFALADTDVAAEMQASAQTHERDEVAARWQRPAYQPLKHARRCYGHLAGELGVAHLKMLLARGYLVEHGAGFDLTPAGRAWLEELGVKAMATTGRLAYRCMDWSERQDHLAGSLAKALLEHYLRQGWLRADQPSRALHVTARGERDWLPKLQLAKHPAPAHQASSIGKHPSR